MMFDKPAVDELRAAVMRAQAALKQRRPQLGPTRHFQASSPKPHRDGIQRRRSCGITTNAAFS